MLVGYDKNDSKKAALVGKGTGGMDELTQNLPEDEILYGVFKVIGVDDDSKRTKFVAVTWVGPKVKPMARARVSTHKSEFLKFFTGHHIAIHASSLSEISKEDIIEKLNSSTGAHKPKEYQF